MDLIDQIRYGYSDDDGCGPGKDGVITFSYGCPQLCQRGKTMTIFCLSCSYIGHIAPTSPKLQFLFDCFFPLVLSCLKL